MRKKTDIFKKNLNFEFIKRQHLNAARRETRQELDSDILELHGITLFHFSEYIDTARFKVDTARKLHIGLEHMI
jgi:hypothetical protein